MNTATRAGRVAVAHRLSEAVRRAPGDTRPDASDTPGPIGDCGRSADSPCGMKDESECQTHADVPADDPALLSYAGTLASRKQQLKAARRRGLQR
jgi:hypothetical protein